MKYTNVLAITLFLSLIFGTVACTIPFFNQGEQKVVGRGIKLEVDPDYELPSTLYENQPFFLKMRISNYGISDVSGWLCLSDTPSDTYSGIPPNSCQSVFLEPALKSGTDVKQSVQELLFPDSGSYVYMNLPSQLGSGLKMDTNIVATFSYSTKTIALTNLCIKGFDSQSLTCKNKETITNIQQGEMPIEVTKIEKTVAVSKNNLASIGLSIYLKKMEDGYLINSALNSGNAKIDPTARFAISLAGATLKCSPLESGDLIRFSTQDEKLVQCIGAMQLSQDLITNPLIITVEYGFQKTANIGPIELKKEVI